jgi:membrane fusion protein (multidrug efflux system)
LDGLKAGDKIAIEGVQSLRDGAAIQPITSAEKEEIYQQNLKDQKEGNMQSAMQ